MLHTPRYGEQEFAAKLTTVLNQTQSRAMTSVEVALHEGLSVGLAEEMIESAHYGGYIACDEGGTSGLDNWYANILQHHPWDGESE